MPFVSEKLGTAENLVTILDNELDSIISGLHVCHLALQAVIPHDSRREDDSKVLWRHLLEVSQIIL